jgi:polar amino acid transport system substrate-binding protein
MGSLTWSSVLAIAVLTGSVGSIPVAAAELSEIQTRGYLIVGVKDNLRPLGFQNEAGELVGLEIDIARQLAVELLGDPNAVVLVPVQNRDRLPMLLSGDVDMVIAGYTRTHSRSRMVSFSAPYYLDGMAFITRDPRIQTITDAERSPIAVLNESSTIAILRSSLVNPTLIGVESYQAALEMLDAGDVASFAGDTSVLTGWTQQYPDYRLLPTTWTADSLAIAMPRGNQYDDLRRQVNRVIEGWYETGWLQERLEAWGLPF